VSSAKASSRNSSSPWVPPSCLRSSGRPRSGSSVPSDRDGLRLLHRADLSSVRGSDLPSASFRGPEEFERHPPSTAVVVDLTLFPSSPCSCAAGYGWLGSDAVVLSRHDIRPVPRTKTQWKFDHPPSGTCTPGCNMYGLCHCGCGEHPTRSPATVETERRVSGRPYAFRVGHQARMLLRHGGGHWAKRGIAVERVRPLLAWLHHRHGTWEEVAALLQMPASTIKGYANNSRRRRVPPDAAHGIQRLVLAHRTKRSILDQWETEPGIRPYNGLWALDA
jgi:hypothetical protein